MSNNFISKIAKCIAITEEINVKNEHITLDSVSDMSSRLYKELTELNIISHDIVKSRSLESNFPPLGLELIIDLNAKWATMENIIKTQRMKLEYVQLLSIETREILESLDGY